MRGQTERTPERLALVRRLRDEDGLTWREIADRVGIAFQTAHMWYSDPDGAQQKARKESYRGTCAVCGAPTGGDVGPGGRRFCIDCGPKHGGQVAGAAHAEAALPRRQEVARRWRAGETSREIAEALGTTPRAVDALITTLRASGWDVPIRRSLSDEALYAMRNSRKKNGDSPASGKSQTTGGGA